MSYFRPYRYVKKRSFSVRPGITSLAGVNKKFALANAGPILLSGLGAFFLLTQVAIPLVSFKTQDETSKTAEASVLGLASGFREFEFEELQSAGGTSSASSVNVPKFYYLSIPKLKIDHALIDTSPENLSPDEALGHYVGSNFPDEPGNTFIYGHSVLPAFYNPKNYKTIFSTLHLLEIGDEFTIEYNNKKYTYKVESKEILKPDKVDPLKGFKPAYLNESTITLMTCSPPGTRINRLLVNAVLVN